MTVQPQPASDSPLTPTGPLTAGDLLDRAFRLYRARFGLFLLTGAVLFIPVALVSGFFLERSFASYMQTLEALAPEPPRTELDPFSFFSGLSGDFANMILVSLLLAAAGAIVYLSLAAQAVETLRGGPLPLIAGLRRGVNRFLPYVGMAVVQLAAIAAVAVVVLAPLVLLGIALLAVGGTDASGAPLEGARAGEGGIFAAFGIAGLAVCGFGLALLLLLAPTVYLAARWLVAPAVLVVEGAGPIDAIRRSWRLSRDNVLRMVGYLVLFNILEMIFMAVPLAALQYSTMLMTSSTGPMLSLSTISSSLITVFALPFFVAAVVLLYYDLRIRGRTTT
ncbi:MAG: glycerophosphoryl diester phosphodiesterase membrane domain-containing protein [Caldilineaceae bacterium]|nr:glycerophosphoryl diester phosphodiesterase membrane domain-containing protein [Caldilineaceae bacterium]